MDQVKIGKFIAGLRKEKNMTQLDLANRLGITDRAVSKWENGRGMPDLAIMKPLCEELSISINELFCGERIIEAELSQKAEEIIVNTLQRSDTEIKKTKRTFAAVLISIIGVILLLFACFAVDVHRMRNDKPVVFSTWGFEYAPPVDLKYEKIEYAIKEYLEKQGDIAKKDKDGVKTFVALRTYLIEETEKDQYDVYVWVLEEQCYIEKDDVMNYGSYFLPFKFKVKKQEQNDKFTVVDSRHPRDGGYHSEDMKNLFPTSVLKDMNRIYIDGTFERLQLKVEEQVQLYFRKEAYPFVS